MARYSTTTNVALLPPSPRVWAAIMNSVETMPDMMLTRTGVPK